MHMRKSPLDFFTKTIGAAHYEVEGSIQPSRNSKSTSLSIKSSSMGETLYGALAIGFAPK